VSDSPVRKVRAYRQLEWDAGEASNPYPSYARMRAQGPIVRRDGTIVTTTRAAADAVLRHPERFSSSFPNIATPGR